MLSCLIPMLYHPSLIPKFHSPHDINVAIPCSSNSNFITSTACPMIISVISPSSKFIHCILILLCLTVICAIKPYKKAHVNVMEALMIMALFGATLAILDEQDIYVGPVTSICFIAFPFVFGILFILYKLFMYLW